jgi:hypothetical protein
MMPSWRWLLAYPFVVALFVTVLFAVWYHSVTATPTRTGLEGIGLVLPLSAAISTATGTIVRMVTLVVRDRSGVVYISIFGAVLLTAAVLGWANW